MTRRTLAVLALGVATLATPLVPAHANLCDHVTDCPGVRLVCEMLVSGCTSPYVGCYHTPDAVICI